MFNFISLPLILLYNVAYLRFAHLYIYLYRISNKSNNNSFYLKRKSHASKKEQIHREFLFLSFFKYNFVLTTKFLASQELFLPRRDSPRFVRIAHSSTNPLPLITGSNSTSMRHREYSAGRIYFLPVFALDDRPPFAAKRENHREFSLSLSLSLSLSSSFDIIGRAGFQESRLPDDITQVLRASSRSFRLGG